MEVVNPRTVISCTPLLLEGGGEALNNPGMPNRIVVPQSYPMAPMPVSFILKLEVEAH